MVTAQRDELIAEVIRNLETRPSTLAFSPMLEEYYRSSIARRRRRSMVTAIVIGLVILAAFVIHRAFFTGAGDPVVFHRWLSTMAAIAVIAFLTLIVSTTTRSHRVIDRVTVAAMIAVGVLVATSFRIETGPAATIGIYCAVMVPIATTNLAALHFRQALLAITVSDVIYASALLTMPTLDPVVHLPALLLVLSVSAMTLWGSWRDDRSHRSLFLFMTRERLIAERSVHEAAELREMTTLDPLTGIPNRRAFEERLAAAFAKRGEDPIVLAMIDIDHFKAFNDAHGHLEGDRALVAVARALAGELRGEGDLVARLGGEEFAVMAPGPDHHDAIALLERLRRAVEKLAIPHGAAGEQGAVVTVSLGCVVVEAGSQTTRRDALERADRALYAAKHAGRNRWVLYEPKPYSDREAGLPDEIGEIGL